MHARLPIFNESVTVSIQFSSVAQSCLFATPWTVARKVSLSIANSWSLLKLMSTESVMPSNHLILSCPGLLLPSIFPSIRVFSKESVLLMWPKHWSFSIRHRPFHWDISTVFQDASSSPPPLFVFSLTLFFKSVASPLLISRGCKIAFDHILREKVGTPRLTGSSY